MSACAAAGCALQALSQHCHATPSRMGPPRAHTGSAHFTSHASLYLSHGGACAPCKVCSASVAMSSFMVIQGAWPAKSWE